MRPPEVGPDAELRVPHGDPEAIRAAGARLHRVSGRALATAGVRGDAAADLSLVWSGTAADDAEHELAVLSARARRLLPQVDEAGHALMAYADALEWTIGRTTALRLRAESARAEHARLVTAARAAGLDPVAEGAALARAELRLSEALGDIHRAHGRALDDFMTAGTRCARTLSGLAAAARALSGSRVFTGGGGLDGLLAGLPLVELQIRVASAPPIPPIPPGESGQPSDHSWGQSALVTLGEAAAWTYNHTAVPAVNAAADVAQAMAEHPEDLVEMAFGATMIFVGGGGQVGGLALDATGVGAVAGVPLHVAAAGLLTAGAATTAHGATSLLDHASRNDNRLLREVDGPYADRGGPRDPLPDWQRPDGAGATWKGRVSDNGKGEVWQHPDKIDNPLNHEDANSMRYMDPTDRYPDGYVRYHGETGQSLDLHGKPGSRSTSHHPMTPEYTYDIPKGWNP